MKSKQDDYQNYLRTEVDLFESASDDRRREIRSAIGDALVSQVLDIGCGAGQELLPFTVTGATKCVGIDVQLSAGVVFNEVFARRGLSKNAAFVQGKSEFMPFGSSSFDLLICRVALPYMNSRLALREMERVLRPEGRLVLKIHSPLFYWKMIRERLRSLSAKQLAYPTFCFIGGTYYWLTGNQPNGSFWNGKETFHTLGMLKRELSYSGLRIEKIVGSDSEGGRLFVIVKD